MILDLMIALHHIHDISTLTHANLRQTIVKEFLIGFTINITSNTMLSLIMITIVVLLRISCLMHN